MTTTEIIDGRVVEEITEPDGTIIRTDLGPVDPRVAQLEATVAALLEALEGA